MEKIQRFDHNVFEGGLDLEKGSIGKLIKMFGADIIIGHPTFQNEDNIPLQLKKGILGAAEVFSGRKVAFVVTDGSFTAQSKDKKTAQAALKAGSETLKGLPVEKRRNIFVFAGPYEGYDNDRTPGKGSALKMVFEEMAFTDAKTLILLDGDLKNDMAEWQAVYKKVIEKHEKAHPGRDCFITARYARHFVDASLTRNVVGPLTTLMGQYVPGGISGDIVLSRGAVELERKSPWGDARRRYGTDISTTFDNIANGTVIYEVYLGAKLHDVTDDAKLAVMPGEVIGAALERLLDYEKRDGRVSALLKSSEPVKTVIALGPADTGISFINPGFTDVFNLKAKRSTLVDKYPQFEASMKKVLREKTMVLVHEKYGRLVDAVKTGKDSPLFMDISKNDWINILYEAVGYTLASGDLENAKKALNYLYTAAFLEFCKLKLNELGHKTASAIEAVQGKLGYDGADAETFYTEKVDQVVRDMAIEFYNGRKAILARMAEVKA
jgi:hypothetical protein